jgi:choice-of-anchor B domain-containing protein
MNFKKLLLNLILLFVLGSGYSQENFNMDLVAHVDIGEAGNDCWGWVDAEGTEFAIIGSRNSTKIYSLEDPSNPSLVISIPGSSSTWRDIKTFGDFIYVVADSGNDGLLVIDMTSYKDSIPHKFWKPSLAVGSNSSTLTTSHNIYIDNNGYGYLAGASAIHPDSRKRGWFVLDLFTDSWNPSMVAFDTTAYAHDVVVQDDLLYASEIFEGQLGIYDVSDKSDMKLLGKVNTSFNFTHNAWPSHDGKYVFTTDERGDAFVDAYDISDLDNIRLLDKFQPEETKNLGVIPHNTHYLNGYLITSWYTDGVVIIDANKPENMVKVGSFDTYGGGHGGFSGCWGAYPFLPSGLILASDINSGLYILNPNYKRAYYVEGNITDKDNSAPINNVEVTLKSANEQSTSSGAMGHYSMGQAEGGSFEVTFSHPDYLPATEMVNLEQGECINLDVSLQKRAEVNITMATLKTADGGPVPNGSIILISESQTFEINTDATGNFAGTFFKDSYDVYGGAWGYLHKSMGTIEIDNGAHIEIELEKGYQDDYIFDLGWTVDGDATAGHWERGIPIATFLGGEPANADVDIDGDYGKSCYVTGNGGLDVGFDDVDRGLTRLTSDVMDLSDYNDPKVEYYLWFVNVGGGAVPNDSLAVKITNGSETVLLENITESSSGWREKSVFTLSDYIEVNNQIRLILETSDDQTNEFGHIVEAGIDAFLVTEGETSSIIGLNDNLKLSYYPNPFSQDITLEYELESSTNASIQVFDVLGSLRSHRKLNQPKGTISLGSDLASGIYFINMVTSDNEYHTIKVIKE